MEPSLPGATAPAPLPASAPLLTFGNQRRFYWKMALLGVTTVALAPILLWKNELAAIVYVVALTIVHVAGVIVIAVGAKKQDIAPTKRGLVIRLAAIAILVGLLMLAANGLTSRTSAGDAPAFTSTLFWSSLFAIWALHTGGLALLHLRGRNEVALCPFV